MCIWIQYLYLDNALRSSYIQIDQGKHLELIHDDSSETGELQTKSALNLIVFGPKLEHLDLIEWAYCKRDDNDYDDMHYIFDDCCKSSKPDEYIQP